MPRECSFVPFHSCISPFVCVYVFVCVCDCKENESMCIHTANANVCSGFCVWPVQGNSYSLCVRLLCVNAYVFGFVFFQTVLYGCGYKMRMVRDGYYYNYYYMYGYCDHLDSFFIMFFFGPFVRYSLVGSFLFAGILSIVVCVSLCPSHTLSQHFDLFHSFSVYRMYAQSRIQTIQQ